MRKYEKNLKQDILESDYDVLFLIYESVPSEENSFEFSFLANYNIKYDILKERVKKKKKKLLLQDYFLFNKII
jgi:hypothetical protein